MFSVSGTSGEQGNPPSGDGASRGRHHRPREDLGKDIAERPAQKPRTDLQLSLPGDVSALPFTFHSQRDGNVEEQNRAEGSNNKSNAADVFMSSRRAYETLAVSHAIVSNERDRLQAQRDAWIVERASLLQQIQQLRQERNIPISVGQGTHLGYITGSGGFETTGLELKLYLKVPPTPGNPRTTPSGALGQSFIASVVRHCVL